MSARALLEGAGEVRRGAGAGVRDVETVREVLRALHDEGALQWNESSGVVRALALDAPSTSSGAFIAN